MKSLLVVAVLSLNILVPAAQAQVTASVPSADYYKPPKFEPFLKQHPADEQNQEYALKWYGYGNYQKSLSNLKYHTFQMVRYHPSNGYISYVNGGAFYAHPQFLLETISRLEKKVDKQHVNRGSEKIYFNLAQLCRQGAIPPPVDAASRLRFLRYYQMPSNSQLPKSVNLPLAYKSVHFYKAAIKSASGDKFSAAFYSNQLATLYRYLGRNQEAIKVCEAALPQADAVSKPGLLVTYGRCLRTANRINDAKSALGKVKEIDHVWYRGHGPDRNTVEAETELGLIALSEGDLTTASNHLLTSVKIVKAENANIYTVRTREGLPVGFRLAEKLLAAKQSKVVTEWCEIILKKFWKSNVETQQLLKKATAAS
jgi:tetratricopeptide (TPR) repeat protein